MLQPTQHRTYHFRQCSVSLAAQQPQHFDSKYVAQRSDMMPPKLPKMLLPRQLIDHRIELLSGAKPPAQVPCRMTPLELVELRKKLNELLDAGLIQPLTAPCGALVLFQKKQDETLRMSVDHQALNKVTIKNKHPMPLVIDYPKPPTSQSWTCILGIGKSKLHKGMRGRLHVTRYGINEFL